MNVFITKYTDNNAYPLYSYQREIVDRFLQQPDSSYSVIIDNIRKVYPPRDGNVEKIAVNGFTLSIQRGQCFGLLGSNGAGKTSLISMVCHKSYFYFNFLSLFIVLRGSMLVLWSLLSTLLFLTPWWLELKIISFQQI